MPNCLFRKSDGKFIGGAMNDQIAHDPATHVQLSLPVYPDRRAERWDGQTGVRAATAQEIVDHDDVEAQRDLDAEFVGSKIGRLIFEINFDQENRIRVLEGKQAVTKAQYLAALKDRYKAL